MGTSERKPASFVARGEWVPFGRDSSKKHGSFGRLVHRMIGAPGRYNKGRSLTLENVNK